MKFYEKNTGFFEGKKNGFNFTIASAYEDDYYVVASHLKKDIRLNTLWIKKTFKTKEIAEKFCEKFDYTLYNCIGDNA